MLRLLGRVAISTITFLAGTSLPPRFAARKAAHDTQLPAPLPHSDIAYPPFLLEELALQSQPIQVPTPSPSPAEDEWDSVPHIPPVVISPERMLVTVGNTIYMTDSHRRIVWKWPEEKLDWWPAITDQPLIIGDTVYVIAMDLTHVALDLRTGKEKWRGTACGRAGYKQLAKYGKNQYLLLVDMSGYAYTDKDRLEAFDLNNNTLWDVDFPRAATLQVWNGKIYAVARTENSVRVTEIKPPCNHNSLR
ncbi:MAG: hypothetical protein LC746_18670 [Acidobacteria bacterium]|nr:hypothetical protein [Acidobacteriota bacterium]